MCASHPTVKLRCFKISGSPTSDHRPAVRLVCMVRTCLIFNPSVLQISTMLKLIRSRLNRCKTFVSSNIARDISVEIIAFLAVSVFNAVSPGCAYERGVNNGIPRLGEYVQQYCQGGGNRASCKVSEIITNVEEAKHGLGARA